MAFGDTIAATVLGKPSVPEDTDATANAVAEGAAVNTYVGITAHSTFANGDANLDYSLSADSSGGGFKIDQSTGMVTVADPSKIDFESAPGHAYTITVVATKNGNFSSQQTFTINVNDVAPSTPVDSNPAANTVLEGAAAGTTVGITASATDVNGGAITWSLTGDTSGGGFTINPTTGVITVADGSKIDYESSAGHAYTVTATASDGTLTHSQTFTINVGDVAMTTPVDSDGAANSVAEGAANGTAVGVTVSAGDPNGPATTYSLTDSAGGRFAINSTTGVVTVANGAAIDFETASGHAYGITVQATSGAQTTTQAFVIGVTDVAPSTPTDADAAGNTVFELAANGTPVGITASSSDPGGGPAPTFALTDSAGGRFAINATTGVVTVANGAAIDFETAPSHTYSITVQSTAGALSSTPQTFSIAVANVNEAPAGTDKTVTIAEDNAYTFGVADFGFSDPADSSAPNSLLAVKMTTVPGAGTGTFTNNGVTVNAGDFISATDIAAGHLVFTPALNANGSPEASFTFQVRDNGGTANGGVDLDQSPNTLTINVTAVNDAPVNSVPGTQGVNEDATLTFSSGAGNAITISDVDVGAGNETVTLTVTSGTLALGSTAGLASFTNNAASINLTGTVANIKAALNGLTYHGNLNFNGTDTLVVSTNDNGNTGSGGAKTDTDNVTINVASVNDAPAGTDKTVTMIEGDSYTFSVADFGFSDPNDSSSPNSLLSVKMTTVPGAGTGTLTNNGVAVNANDFVLATDIAAGHLVFTPTAHSNGSPEASFTFQVQDNGGTANGGVDLDQSPNTVTINVNAVNDAPVNSVPAAAQNVNEEGNLVFSSGNGNAITISDIDVGSGNETVTLTVTGGTLALGSHAGLVSFSPDHAASITLTGTIANVNNAMNGLTYTGNLNFNGTDTLVVSTNDNGNTGAGGPKIDSDSVVINVAAVNDAPVNGVPGLQTVNEDTNLVFSTANGNAVSISDVDAGAGNETVTLSVASGALTLNGTAGLAFTVGDGTADSTMTFSGTVAAINTALNGMGYQGNLNFNGSDTFTITTNDNGNTGSGGALSDTDSFTINVTAVNDAPVVTAGHTLNYTENQAATAIDTALTVSDVDSANLASATVQISAGYVNGEDVLAFTNTPNITGSFNAATGTLTLTGSDSVANYQTALRSVTYVNTSDNPSGADRTVTITANDGALNSAAATDTIHVTPVNDAPVVTAGHVLNYTENQAATAIDPAIAVSDVDSANLASATVQITANYVNGEDVLGFTNTATITGSFNAATGTLTLTGSDTVANYQAALASVTYVNTSDNPSGAARTVTIVTNDGALNSVAATDTINVTPVNDAPVATAGHTLSYTENDPATAIDTAFTVTDVDSANLTSATVQISANYVNGQDVLGFTNTATITGSFNAATGTLTLSGSDTVANYQAALRSVTYANGSEDPSAASRTVTIVTSDGSASSAAVTDTITVQPVNDAPTLSATGNNPNYNAGGVDLFSTVTASTIEAGQKLDQLKLTVSNISGTAADSLTIDGTPVALTDGNVVSTSTPGVTATVAVSGSTATVTIDSSSGLTNSAMAALVDGLSYTDTNVNPGDPARVVTITQLHDTGGTSPGVDTTVLNITSTVFFDQAPVVTAGHTLNYTENQAATALDTTLTVTDTDSANLASATVQITGNYVNGEDVLAFSNTATITGSFNASTGTMTLTGSDSVANYQAALRAITYVNTSDNPSGAPRTVTITANDGFVNSTPVTDTINVTPVNDAPVVTAGHTLNYTEDQAPTAIDPAITVTDVDSANLASATVQITGNYVSGEDLLAFSNTATITGSFNAGTGTLTLTGSDTVANYQAALASVTYVNNSQNPSGLARTVTFIANDGAANSVAATDTINVTPVNDAPVTTAGGTLNYTENQAATAIDASVTVTDVDNTNMASATVAITGGFASGQDVLDANVTGTSIGKSYNAATGVLTLTGSDTKTHYQQVLDSVSYFNSSDNPSGADRTVSYTVNDGALNSNTSTATVHVTPVNDAPVVTATGTLAYTEDDGATAIAPALTVTDVDTATLTTASVVISANYVNGEDVLGFTNTANITGSFNAATGTMTLTGTDTVANYQAALRSVTYTDTSENPSTTSRTVTFTVDDGQSVNHLSAGSNHTITVASVDDAPTVTVPGAQDGVSAHTDTAIAGISTNDVDAGSLAVKVSLATSHGNITLDLSGGATLADATSNGSHSVHITGTLTQVNSALSSLIYHGDAGFTGADALTVQTNDLGHTGTGGPLSSSVGTVNIGVIPKVWFIDNSATGAQDGSQAHPFQSIAAFNAINDGAANHAQAGDYIYLKTGTGVYSEADGIHLLNSQQLVGGGDSLSFTDPLNNANTITIATAGTRPVIDVTGAGNDAIHLAQDNTIHGFNIATDNATAIGIVDNGGTVGTLNISNMDVGVDPDSGGPLSGNLGQAISITHGGTAGSMTFGTVNSAGGASGIALGGTLATNFSATGGTLSGHSTSEVAISGGSGTVSYAGTIGDGSGLSASVSGRTGGTVTLSGNINDGADAGGGITVSGNSSGTIDFTGATKTLNTVTGNAVALSSNSGATIDFTNGGLNIDTTTGTGFSASGGGTVSVTGSANTIDTTTGTALNLNGVTIGSNGVTFASVNTNGAANGILIDTVTGGAIAVNGGAIAGATTRGVDINAAQTNITVASSIASTGSGNSVEVTGSGKAGGSTIAFSGGITDAGGGINLDNNDQNGGATINFTGALNIDSTTHTGFNAINGGTVNATNAANSINTTTGTALNVANTTIGSSNLIFHDISSNGAASGIILNTTGSSGGLTVTGDGLSASNHSGGQILASTGPGVSLNSTSNVSLGYLDITNGSDDGIHGESVNNFTLNRSNVQNNGNSTSDDGIQFGLESGNTVGLTGNVTISNSSITNNAHNDIHIRSTSGTLSSFNVSGTTVGGFAGNNASVGNAANAFLFEASGTSSVTAANISGSTIQNNHSERGLEVQAHDTATISNFTVQSSTFTNNGIGASFTQDTSSNLDFNFKNNTMTSNVAGALQEINVFSSSQSTGGSITGEISGTTIGTPGVPGSGSSAGPGISIVIQGQTDSTLLINNNTIQGIGGTSGSPGITASFRGPTATGLGTTSFNDITITNNTVFSAPAATSPFAAIFVSADNQGSPAQVRADIHGNTVPATGSFDYPTFDGNGAQIVYVVSAPGATAQLVDTGVADANATGQLSTANTKAGGGNAVGYATPNPGGVTLIAGPIGQPPMNAAPGGVQSDTPTPGETHLSQAQLDSVVAAAIAQWAAAGASQSQLAAMLAVNFTVDHLGGKTIGEAVSPTHISIDDDAAGHGWFVDPTPNDNSEFTHAANTASTDLYTDPSSTAAGHLDLLTTITHELGHIIGLDDTTDANTANDLMYINLVDGERRIPDAGDVAHANGSGAIQAEAALPVSAQAASGTPLIVGTPGNDTMDAGHGGTILFGGAGADKFVFGAATPLDTPTPAQVTHVADYHAAEGDSFDFSAITSQFHNSSVNDALVVRAVEDSSGKFATLQVDHIDPMGLPSAPNWVNVAQIDGAHAGDSVNVLIDNHSVHLAQIHVDLLV
jgi:large repetitive protein